MGLFHVEGFQNSVHSRNKNIELNLKFDSSINLWFLKRRWDKNFQVCRSPEIVSYKVAQICGKEFAAVGDEDVVIRATRETRRRRQENRAKGRT